MTSTLNTIAVTQQFFRSRQIFKSGVAYGTLYSHDQLKLIVAEFSPPKRFGAKCCCHADRTFGLTGHLARTFGNRYEISFGTVLDHGGSNGEVVSEIGRVVAEIRLNYSGF